MNCKFCNAELPEDVTVCPECGKDNLEEIPQVVEEPVVEEAAEEMTEAAEVPAEEQAPAKNTTGVWVKILAAIGVLALVAVLAGAVIYGVKAYEKKAESYTVSDTKAVKERDTVVATVGDVELTNNALQVYYWQAINDFYSSYGYYLDESVLDFDEPLDEQFYDEEAGLTWQQFFLDSALTTWSRYAALNMQAQEDGYTLTDEVEEYIASVPDQLEETAVYYGYETAEEMLKADMSVACDMTGYMDYLRINMHAGQYLDSRYDSLIPSMEEIENYYAENETALNEEGIYNDGSITTDVRHILICPEGGTEDEEGNITYSDEEWETCRARAQELLDQWQVDGATEELFAEMAMEYSEDLGSISTGGLYTDIYEGEMVEPFENWCFDESRAYGDTGLVQTTYGYHIMYFVASEEIWVANVRDTIIYDRSITIVEDAVAKWPMEANYKKIILGQVGSEAEETVE